MIEINFQPSRKELRFFAALLIIFFGIVAWFVYRGSESSMAAGIVFGVPAAIGLVGLVVPQWMRPLYVGWMVAVFPIGWLISHLVMAIIFYLAIWPIGLIMKLAGQDPMRRKLDREAESYWISRPPAEGTRRYFKQY